MTTPLSLRVAVVLYRPELRGLQRMLDSVVESVEHARAEGLVDDVDVRLGDCSTDPLPDPPEAEGVATAYEHFGANLWHSGGVNRLLDGLDRDAALLVNPDVVLDRRCVSQLTSAMRADERIGLVDARQVPFEHPKPHDPATNDTGWASMAVCLVRGETWREVGPLDDVHFPMHGNDVDFSWRARLAGWRVVHAPAARALHDKRLTAIGAVAPSEVEEEHGARAALLLPWIYSRPDVVAAHFRILEAGTPPQRRGAAAVRDLLARGPLPPIRDPERQVGEFVDGAFAAHRF